MKIKTTCFNQQVYQNKVRFRHFKEGEDEQLRCTIQNSVFAAEDRVPLVPEDISFEEYEDYYIKNFGVFIYNNNGQAIGYGQIILNRGLYTMVNIGVINNYRRQGYGELLVKYLVEFCYNNSIKNIYIRVERKNTKALSLYNKVGFRECKSIFTWYKNIDFF
jgi:ribosomal protein S18 acetylase RimI-like enzyme